MGRARKRIFYLANSEHNEVIVVNASRFTEANFSQPQRSVVFKDKAGQLMNVAVPDNWRADVTPDMVANTKAHPHFFTYCRDQIASKSGVDDPDAFCSWLHHQVEGVWPSEKANERLEFVGNAVEFSHGSDGWVQLTPYGRFAHDKGDQLFTKDDASAMVNAFDAGANVPQRALGIPWYIGHPDHIRFKDDYKDKRAYGRIKKLEAREDGLWGNVRWSSDGKKLIEDQAFHGHSVNWGVVKRGEFWRPVALKSVGFTNEPNIPVLPVTAANERTMDMKKDKLAKMLGLDPEKATEEEIENALANELANAKSFKEKLDAANEKLTVMSNVANEKKAVEDKLSTATVELTNERTARKTDVEAEQKKVKSKDDELANERKAHVKSVLDMAIIGGCVTIAERPKFEQEFANDHGGALTKVLGLKPKMHTQSSVSPKDKRLGIPQDRRTQFLANVKKRQQDNPHMTYNDCFNAEKAEHPDMLQTTV